MRKLLSTFFGIGYLSGPSGTYASAAAAAIALGAFYLGAPLEAAAAAIVVVTALSIWAGQSAEKDFGREDPSQFVLDEVAGQFIAILPLWLPWNPHEWSWATALVAFFWFRVTDIVKPSPAREAENLPGGWGITLDDVIAGVMSLILTLGCQMAAERIF